MGRELLTNMHTKATLNFCKYTSTTTAMKINSKKNIICQVYCCTICSTFGVVVGKSIIQSFDHLRIMWVVKLVVGGELIKPEIKKKPILFLLEPFYAVYT